MDSTGENSAARHMQQQAFADRLSTLKEEGSALLVVGELAPDQYRHACHRMLGDDAAATRRRVLVTTDEAARSPRARLPPGASPPRADTTTHVTYATQARAAAVAASPPSGIPTKHVDDRDLSALGITISEAIAEFEQSTSELAPAELRVCFDSLRPLLGEYDTDTVFQFLHLLTGRIRDVRGMGHFHLPVASERESVRILAPLFDATVELRCTGESLQQRWRIPDEDVATSWFSV